MTFGVEARRFCGWRAVGLECACGWWREVAVRSDALLGSSGPQLLEAGDERASPLQLRTTHGAGVPWASPCQVGGVRHRTVFTDTRSRRSASRRVSEIGASRSALFAPTGVRLAEVWGDDCRGYETAR